ncbi:hypothetical protein [Nocardia sp. NPDC004123]
MLTFIGAAMWVTEDLALRLWGHWQEDTLSAQAFWANPAGFGGALRRPESG